MLVLTSKCYGYFEALANPRAWALFSEHQSCLSGKNEISQVSFFCSLSNNRIDDQNISASLGELSWVFLCYSAALSWVCNIEGKLAGPLELQNPPVLSVQGGSPLAPPLEQTSYLTQHPCERCQPQQWALTALDLLLLASPKYPIHLDVPEILKHTASLSTCTIPLTV